MNKSGLLVRLHQHQEVVLTIMREAAPLLASTSPRDVAALARARWALMRGLIAYQHFKHRELFDPVIARRVLGEAARAERMKCACVAIADDFRTHLTKWSARDVAAEWADYRPAALRMAVRLRDHIARERREIAAMLELA